MKIIPGCMLFLMLVSCAANKKQNITAPIPVFAGGKWSITELSENQIDIEKSGKEPPYMDFNLAESKVSIFAGCNRISCGFTVKSDSIIFGQLLSTRMACPNMEYENALERLLVPGNYTFMEQDNTLFLVQNGSKVISFVRP